MKSRTLSALAAGAGLIALSTAAQAQSSPQFENLAFANDTSWLVVEYIGDPVSAYGPSCGLALQMDIRRMSNGSRELVVQTACEYAMNTDISYIVSEGQAETTSNLAHSGRQFYDVSADGREIRFVREFDPSILRGLSRDRVRIRVNNRDNATRGRIFWESRRNGQWRVIGYAIMERLRDHDVLRPVPDENAPVTARVSSAAGPAARTRQRPMAIRPISADVSNMSMPTWTLGSDFGIIWDTSILLAPTGPDDARLSAGPPTEQYATPSLGGRPDRRARY